MVVQIINGNALEELKKLPDESIDCIITSPPYYGLRAYKGAETIWGGDVDCEHEFVLKNHYTAGQSDKATTVSPIKGLEKEWEEGFCSKCGAWKGQLGLEPNYQMYLEHLLMITAELKRVLKKTGTLFWNMGDTYVGGHIGGSIYNKEWYISSTDAIPQIKQGRPQSHVKDIPEKSLMMLPERFAIGMIEQGWILRNKIIWFKPNGLPSSVKDRFTNKWEYIFFFVKSRKYYFDLDSVRVPLKQSSIKRIKQNVIDQFVDTKVSDFPDQNMNIKNILLHMQSKYLKDRTLNGSLDGRVMRNVADGIVYTKHDLAINRIGSYNDPLHTKPYNLNGASSGDIIPYHPKGNPEFGIRLPPQPNQEHAFNVNGANPGDFLNVPTRPHSFVHFAVYPVTLIAPLIKVGCPHGGVVLDPFAGSGTTGVVAEILGRNSILIEISKEYIDIINWRLQSENLEKEKKVIMNNAIFKNKGTFLEEGIKNE